MGGCAVRISADRCGGNWSAATIDVDGVEKYRARVPDDDLQKEVSQKLSEHPKVMPYFFLQHHEYKHLKEKLCEFVLSPQTADMQNIATIETAYETLKIAEILWEKALQKFSAAQ